MKRSLWVAALGVIGLAGCVSPAVVGGVARFQLDRTVPATLGHRPDQPVPAAVVGPVGSVTIDLSALRAKLLARRVLWTAADVEKVTIYVTVGKFITSVEILKAELVAGKAVHTFSNIPVGMASVNVTVRGANNVFLGQDTFNVAVTANTTAQLKPTVELLPSRVVASPTPEPGGGGNGGGAASLGGLGLELDVRDGGEAPPMQVLVAPNPAIKAMDLGLDLGKNLWLKTTSAGPSQMVKLSSSGTVLAQGNQSIGGLQTGQGPLRFDTVGNLLAPNGIRNAAAAENDPSGHYYKISPTGQLLSTLPFAAYDIALAPDGSIWGVQDKVLTKYDAAGSPLFAKGFPNVQDTSARIEVDGAGVLWLMTWSYLGGGDRLFEITRYAATGEVLGSYQHVFASSSDLPYAGEWTWLNSNTFYNFRLDAQGNAWVLNPIENQIMKFTPALTVEKTIDTAVMPTAFDIAPDGKVWVICGVDYVMRYAQDGTRLGAGTLRPADSGLQGLPPKAIAVDGNNSAWLVDGSGEVKRVGF